VTTPAPPAPQAGAPGGPHVLDIPDRLDDTPDPRVALAVAAMDRQAAGDPGAGPLLARLAAGGVVALRTSRGHFELRRTAAGWLLLRHPGDPDPAGLAAAADIRARRLAHPTPEQQGTP
jgi:hypothetical protein